MSLEHEDENKNLVKSVIVKVDPLTVFENIAGRAITVEDLQYMDNILDDFCSDETIPDNEITFHIHVSIENINGDAKHLQSVVNVNKAMAPEQTIREQVAEFVQYALLSLARRIDDVKKGIII